MLNCEGWRERTRYDANDHIPNNDACELCGAARPHLGNAVPRETYFCT